jgi:hypothetical protein
VSTIGSAWFEDRHHQTSSLSTVGPGTEGLQEVPWAHKSWGARAGTTCHNHFPFPATRRSMWHWCPPYDTGGWKWSHELRGRVHGLNPILVVHHTVGREPQPVNSRNSTFLWEAITQQMDLWSCHTTLDFAYSSYTVDRWQTITTSQVSLNFICFASPTSCLPIGQTAPSYRRAHTQFRLERVYTVLRFYD